MLMRPIRALLALCLVALTVASSTAQTALDLNALDTEQVFQEMMSNLVSIDVPGEPTPLETILDVIGEVNRATPTDPNGVATADDVHAVIGQLRQFLSSDTRGLERLFDVVQSREL